MLRIGIKEALTTRRISYTAQRTEFFKADKFVAWIRFSLESARFIV